jgi:hypothetical protein
MAVIFIVPIVIASVTTSVQLNADTNDMMSAPIGIASSNTQFQVQVAYAYVGPAPSNVSSYFDEARNTTMQLVSQYPSVVRLQIKNIPSPQIVGCDAIVEVYGIKINTDLGPSEYHAYFMGTNYNPSFSNDSQSKLIQYVPKLVNEDTYSTIVGNFRSNWTSSAPLLTNTIGSITSYTSFSSALGLYAAGKPNAISVTVYRIGYITIANNSVSAFEDSSNSGVMQDMVQLSSYGNGSLYNSLVPTNQLPQTNLFHPNPSP